jgi:hypothetical protein
LIEEVILARRALILVTKKVLQVDKTIDPSLHWFTEILAVNILIMRKIMLRVASLCVIEVTRRSIGTKGRGTCQSLTEVFESRRTRSLPATDKANVKDRQHALKVLLMNKKSAIH